jgi:AbrB family looped-hinge helix DNA binding protein
MGQVATVTSKSMVSIPVRIREKYGIREGSKLEFVESEEGLLLVPVRSLTELRGTFKSREKLVREGIRELGREHRKEARSWSKTL